MRRIVFWILAFLLGVSTALAVGLYAVLVADRAESSLSTIIVRNGHEAWLVRVHRTFALAWVNCERLLPPLVNAVPTIVDIPEWSIPPSRSWPDEGNPRVASLGIGWPAPLFAMQWTTTLGSQIFPLPFELDDGQDSLRRAAGRVLEFDPATPGRILWRGALLDSAFFTLAWAALLWGAAFVLRALFRGEERQDAAHE